MILQVNKVAKEKDYSNFLDSEGFISENAKMSLERKLGDMIIKDENAVFYRNEFGRKTGKTTLINRLAKKYDLPIIVSYKGFKSSYSYSNDVFSLDTNDLRGRGIKLALVDEISYSENQSLRRLGIKTIGFINDSEKPKKNIYEDYIRINSVRQLLDGIEANAREYDIFLSYDKEFSEYGSYNIENRNFSIYSVYLLDDTGKTIKKLM